MIPSVFTRRLVLLLACTASSVAARAQTAPAAAPAPASQQERVSRLAEAVDRAEAQIKASQHELDQLREQLRQMRLEMAATPRAPVAAAEGAGESADKQSEQSSMEQSQIATLDQVKVESVSKFPLRLSGTLLLNTFFNTGHVDQASAPTSVLANHNGTAGIDLRQTVLGLDADGPRLWGAGSHADLRVDFFGGGLSGGYTGTGGLLRLRTAHATLEWPRTTVFFSLDRTILNPEMPESLVSAAQPELAWSGNLWSWNPQLGITQTFGSRRRLQLQAAVVDPGDPGVPPSTAAGTSLPANDLAEASQRPGVETRVAVLGSGSSERSAEFGIGGYYSPHLVATAAPSLGNRSDAWAGTLDYRLPLPLRLVLSGSAYRGEGLGGLGGGAYKDYLVRIVGPTTQFRALDDTGGWTQLHQAVSQRVQWNAGFGIDNGFSKELRAYESTTGTASFYQSIARNRTFFGNVIYSPRSSLLFSLEFRNLYTAPVAGHVWTSNTTGLGAAYRF